MQQSRPCSECNVLHSGTERWCRACVSAFLRDQSKPKGLMTVARHKILSRAAAGNHKRNGLMKPKPCPCGAANAEMHHPDYTKPLEVEWLCRPCHLALHAAERKQSVVADAAVQRLAANSARIAELKRQLG